MSKVASIPIQRFALSGSTRNSQTVSGLAAIESCRSTAVRSVVASMLLALLLFCLAFEGFEPHVPELLEEFLEFHEAFGACPVQAPGAVASLAHEPRLLQDVQMLGDGRPRHVEVGRDLAGAQLLVANEGQDLSPAWRGNCLQRCLHSRPYLSICLR